MSEQASEWPKVVSTWTAPDSDEQFRVVHRPDGPRLESKAWGASFANVGYVLRNAAERIASLESEKSTAQRERDEARAELRQRDLVYDGIRASLDTATLPAPSVAGMPTWEAMRDKWDEPDDLTEAPRWMRLHAWLASRLSAPRPSRVQLLAAIGEGMRGIGPLKSQEECIADAVLRLFPAPERQDGERPSREAVAKALHRAWRDTQRDHESKWEDEPLEAKSGFLVEADAAIWLLSPPLTARSSDATVTKRDVLLAAQAMWNRLYQADEQASMASVVWERFVRTFEHAISLLPARSSAEGERDKKALDEIARAYEMRVEGHPGDRWPYVEARLRETGRLAAKEPK